jgi:hypothetical protein
VTERLGRAEDPRGRSMVAAFDLDRRQHLQAVDLEEGGFERSIADANATFT